MEAAAPALIAVSDGEAGPVVREFDLTAAADAVITGVAMTPGTAGAIATEGVVVGAVECTAPATVGGGIA